MAQDTTVHDVVIIGSGAGGGTVTKVLADLGIKVLLMEAGPMVTADDFKTLASPLDDWHRGAGDAATLYTTGQGAGPLNTSVVFSPNPMDEPYTVAPGGQFRWSRSRVLGGRTQCTIRACSCGTRTTTSRTSPCAAWASTGRSATTTSRRTTRKPSASSA